jgi:hypothetical protein
LVIINGAITRHLRPCNVKSNITKFQASILQAFCGNEYIIIAHMDKNLIPVGVNTTQYICWALDNHLLNTSMYIKVTKNVSLLPISIMRFISGLTTTV